MEWNLVSNNSCKVISRLWISGVIQGNRVDRYCVTCYADVTFETPGAQEKLLGQKRRRNATLVMPRVQAVRYSRPPARRKE